jgi:protein-S-isoprenylcysteine O-methyltransferase Ste14
MFLKAAIAFLALPFMVTAVVPTLLILIDPWRVTNSMFAYIVLIPGLTLLFVCIRDFYTIGKGTLAPWAPPANFVQVGFYKYSRNPMYLGVLLIITGLALRFGSPLTGMFMILFAIIVNINIRFIEEPKLAERFGVEWVQYCKEVPRWFPRLPSGN